jgi:hypothetical protein
MTKRRIQIIAIRRRRTIVLNGDSRGSGLDGSAKSNSTLSPPLTPTGDIIMNTKTRRIAILTTLALTFGLILQQSSRAQSGRGLFANRSNSTQATPSTNSNCKTIRANGVQTFDPLTGVVSGPVTNSGILDGDLEDALNFGAGFLPTPDPNVIAYTTNLTITTNQGQLKAAPVTMQSIVTGNGAEWGEINPITSTGKFAGATGTISTVFKPVGDPSVGPYAAEITADICFAQ